MTYEATHLHRKQAGWMYRRLAAAVGHPMRRTAGLLLAVGMICSACGDDDPIDQLNTLDDCYDVCTAYSECITDIDVSECTDRCEDMAEAVDGGMDVIDDCASCIEGRACAEAAQCVPFCPPIETPAD